MKAKYIGEEDAPGSKSTILFGARRKIGEVFEVPAGFEQKAKYNKFIEALPEAGEAQQQRKGGQQQGRE